jgi:hypothetical protein
MLGRFGHVRATREITDFSEKSKRNRAMAEIDNNRGRIASIEQLSA